MAYVDAGLRLVQEGQLKKHFYVRNGLELKLISQAGIQLKLLSDEIGGTIEEHA